MNFFNQITLCSIFYSLVAVIFPVYADTVTTRNGAKLVGQVSVITSETVTMDTEYAGTITIDIAQVTGLSTDAQISSRLEDGTVISGITEIGNDGYLEVQNETMNIRVPMDRVMASWSPDDTPPKEAGFPQQRSWRYSVGADVTGKNGNSDEMGTSIRADVSLVSELDELKFYLSVDRADTEGEETSNEIIFGSSYVSYFSNTIGWFVSSEIERDPFESIDLRASVSAGLSYWIWNRADHSLQLQTGLGYRHESFDDGSKEDTPTIDIGIDHMWQIKSWLNMNNSLSYVPSITAFSDFLFVQDSALSMPLGSSRWSLRLGLKNSYKNEPAPGRKKLDTTYYSRLLLNFF